MPQKKVVPVLMVSNLVFFPNLTVPIYLEGELSLQVIQDCIENNREVAISMAETVGLQGAHGMQLQLAPRAVCSCGIPIQIEQLGDSSYRVLVKGRRRIRLLSIAKKEPYPLYHFIEIDDATEEGSISGLLVQKLYNVLQEWLELNVLDTYDRKNYLDNIRDSKELVDSISSLMIYDREVRQFLLECNSLIERIHLLYGLLASGGPTLKGNETFSAAQAIKNFESMDPSYKKIC